MLNKLSHRKIKNLHIFTLDKFAAPYVRFIEEHFPKKEHYFYFIGDSNQYPVETTLAHHIDKNTPTTAYQAWNYTKLLSLILRSDKIILHSLYSWKTIRALRLVPWVLPRCYWLIWGGDLYQYQLNSTNPNLRRQERYRQYIIKHIGNLCTYLESDVALARQQYGARGAFHECILYPSNIYKELKVDRSLSPGINILLGNSATRANRHDEILSIVSPFASKTNHIYAPLSYGNREYGQHIAHKGKKLLEEKFTPLMELLPLDQYLQLLADIDIALFNHELQEGMGNTITLLGLGKTLYLRNGTPQWEFLTSLELHIKDIAHFDLSLLTDDQAKANIAIVREYFSEENLVRQYQAIFSS